MDISILASSPARRFAEGKSRFVVLDLAGFQTKLQRLTLAPTQARATVLDDTCGDQRREDSRVVKPVVVFLDERWRQLAIARDGKPTLVKHVDPMLGSSVDVPDGSRYAVVYADARSFGAPIVISGPSVEVTRMLMVTSVVIPVATTVDTTVRGTSAPTGSFTVFANE